MLLVLLIRREQRGNKTIEIKTTLEVETKKHKNRTGNLQEIRKRPIKTEQ